MPGGGADILRDLLWSDLLPSMKWRQLRSDVIANSLRAHVEVTESMPASHCTKKVLTAA